MLSSSLILTPSLAVGHYHQGKGKDLGHLIEFRSSIELSYQLKNQSRIGALFCHLSNASLRVHNPGTECFMLFFALPLF